MGHTCKPFDCACTHAGPAIPLPSGGPHVGEEVARRCQPSGTILGRRALPGGGGGGGGLGIGWPELGHQRDCATESAPAN